MSAPPADAAPSAHPRTPHSEATAALPQAAAAAPPKTARRTRRPAPPDEISVIDSEVSEIDDTDPRTRIDMGFVKVLANPRKSNFHQLRRPPKGEPIPSKSHLRGDQLYPEHGQRHGHDTGRLGPPVPDEIVSAKRRPSVQSSGGGGGGGAPLSLGSDRDARYDGGARADDPNAAPSSSFSSASSWMGQAETRGRSWADEMSGQPAGGPSRDPAGAWALMSLEEDAALSATASRTDPPHATYAYGGPAGAPPSSGSEEARAGWGHDRPSSPSSSYDMTHDGGPPRAYLHHDDRAADPYGQSSLPSVSLSSDPHGSGDRPSAFQAALAAALQDGAGGGGGASSAPSTAGGGAPHDAWQTHDGHGSEWGAPAAGAQDAGIASADPPAPPPPSSSCPDFGTTGAEPTADGTLGGWGNARENGFASHAGQSHYGEGSGAYFDPHADRARAEQARIDEERHAKQNLLIRLRGLKRRGVELTREFTMDDPLDEMQYELDMQEHQRTHVQNVQTVTDYVMGACTLIVTANQGVGALLKKPKGLLPLGDLQARWKAAVDKNALVIETIAHKWLGPRAGSRASSPEVALVLALLMAVGAAIANGLMARAFDPSSSSSGRRAHRRPALRRHRDGMTGASPGWRSSYDPYAAPASPYAHPAYGPEGPSHHHPPAYHQPHAYPPYQAQYPYGGPIDPHAPFAQAPASPGGASAAAPDPKDAGWGSPGPNPSSAWYPQPNPYGWPPAHPPPPATAPFGHAPATPHPQGWQHGQPPFHPASPVPWPDASHAPPPTAPPSTGPPLPLPGSPRASQPPSAQQQHPPTVAHISAPLASPSVPAPPTAPPPSASRSEGSTGGRRMMGRIAKPRTFEL